MRVSAGFVHVGVRLDAPWSVQPRRWNDFQVPVQRKGMAISMNEKRDESVEELAEELESRIIRKAESDELEEIELEDIREDWLSEDETSEGVWEDEFPEDDWEEDEITPMKPWMMAAAMIGVVALAAVICAVLWHFTHLDRGDGGKEAQISASAEDPVKDNDETGGLSGAVPENASTSDPEAATAPGSEASAASSSPAVPPEASPTPAAPQTTVQPGIQASEAIQEPISGTTSMEFTQSNEDVTPKDVINLRSEPSTLDADNIVAQAKNGEILSRTGVNEATGWTRVEYNGETLYAVTQYLTTDLTYKPPVQATNPNRVNTRDGRVILFTDCSDNITPKEYVNLRTEPSTSEGETTVRCQISNGEVVHRTGYSPDAGWSRVEYNGEVLYVVSSYVYTVE